MALHISEILRCSKGAIPISSRLGKGILVLVLVASFRNKTVISTFGKNVTVLLCSFKQKEISP